MRLPGTPTLGPLPPLADTWRRSFVEFLGTFALVFVGVGAIMAVGPQADAGTLEVALAHGIAIGLVVVFDNLMGYPLTGAIINPARALGPQLIGHSWTDAWIWYVGPFAGGAIAALLYDELFLRPLAPPGPPPPPPD